MPTDEEAALYTILNGNWITTNVTKPQFVYMDDIKGTSSYPSIKIYFDKSDEIKPKGLGYPGKASTFHIILDVRSNNRTEVLKVRDEIVRILDKKRIQPASNIDYLTYDEGEKKSSFANFYNWKFRVHLRQIYRDVGAI
jgi:hypothetical protein